MNKIDFSCPKCGCENTVKVTPKMFDGTSTGQWVWWGIMIIIGILSGGIILIIWLAVWLSNNWLSKKNKELAAGNRWIMKCSRCGNEFLVDNPEFRRGGKRHRRRIAQCRCGFRCRRSSDLFPVCVGFGGNGTVIRLLRDGVAAIGFAGILSSASAATFRWSAEVSVLDMAPRHGVDRHARGRTRLVRYGGQSVCPR